MDQNGRLAGSFDFPLPDDLQESYRDFLRAQAAGGIAVLSPTQFEEVWRRAPRNPSCASGGGEAARGDVSAEVAREAVADFRAQLLEEGRLCLGVAAGPGASARGAGPGTESATEGEGGEVGGNGGGGEEEAAQDSSGGEAPAGGIGEEAEAWMERLREVVSQGVVEANLTVSPAMSFAEHARLPRRILQPRFVVLLGPRCLRVATLGFVGEPVMGERPSEQRTPYLVRLLTQNLLEEPSRHQGRGAAIRISYNVRPAAQLETCIAWFMSTEVPALLDVVVGRMPSFQRAWPQTSPPCLRVAGVTIPAGGVEERKDSFTVFRVDVAPADGRAPWMVWKRYQQFYDLYCTVKPATNHLASVSFPRKHWRSCCGDRLEVRRRGLEAWLGEVVREAQSREPGWLKPLCDFLEVQ